MTGELRQQWDSYDVLEALAREARSYLCVGVQEGECLRHVLEGGPYIERVVLCDTWGPHHGGTGRGSHDHIAALLTRLGYTGEVEWLDGESQVLIPQLPYVPAFDLVYVDGSHCEDDAFGDFMNCWPRTRGALVAHDIRMDPVWAAFCRYFSNRDDVRRIECALGHHGTGVVFR